MDSPYALTTCDRFGNNVVEVPTFVGAECVKTLNEHGSYEFTVIANASSQFSTHPWKREVRLWRNGKLYWSGVITRRQLNDLQTYAVTAEGVTRYLEKQVFGDAENTNKLVNGDFGSGTLANWEVVGVTANIVTQWGNNRAFKDGRLSQISRFLPGEVNYQLNLYQAGPGTDTFVQQSAIVDGGVFLTASAMFHIRTDCAWVGPAFDNRGLYVEVLDMDNNLRDVQFFAIDENTPRGIFQRATVTTRTPDGGQYHVRVRLYSPLVTNATPTPPRPPGGIIWADVKLVAEDSLSFSNQDMGAIANGIVAHAQDPAFAKSSYNITPGASSTGIVLDKHYMFIEHGRIWDALREFPESELGDVGVEHSADGKTRTFKVYTPMMGIDRPEPVLEVGKQISRVPVLDEDGTDVATTVIVTGEGSGPDRDEAQVNYLDYFDGLSLVEVSAAKEGTHFDLLGRVASQRLRRVCRLPQAPELEGAGGLVDQFGLGDRVNLHFTYNDVVYYGNVRIVGIALDTKTDRARLTVNPID